MYLKFNKYAISRENQGVSQLDFNFKEKMGPGILL